MLLFNHFFLKKTKKRSKESNWFRDANWTFTFFCNSWSKNCHFTRSIKTNYIWFL